MEVFTEAERRWLYGDHEDSCGHDYDYDEEEYAYLWRGLDDRQDESNCAPGAFGWEED